VDSKVWKKNMDKKKFFLKHGSARKNAETFRRISELTTPTSETFAYGPGMLLCLGSHSQSHSRLPLSLSLWSCSVLIQDHHVHLQAIQAISKSSRPGLDTSLGGVQRSTGTAHHRRRGLRHLLLVRWGVSVWKSCV
jgi:hypothetical protein